MLTWGAWLLGAVARVQCPSDREFATKTDLFGRIACSWTVARYINRVRPDHAPAILLDRYAGHSVEPQVEAPVSLGTMPEPPRPRRRWIAALGLIGLLSLIVSATMVVWSVHQWRGMMASQLQDRNAQTAAQTQRAAAPPASPSASASASVASDTAKPSAPSDTVIRMLGQIEVVDIGLSSPPLDQALTAQRALANVKQQTLLVMLTGATCTPCRGVDAALNNPMMQEALASVRLVRIDLKVFREELAELSMPTNIYPAFLLLDAEMRPLDGIHGGEWDADIAKNIAPILDAFVHGKYETRRHDWSARAGSVQL